MPPLVEVVRHFMLYLPRRLWLSRVRKETAGLDTRGRRLIVILSSDTEFDPPLESSASWAERSTRSLLDGLPRLLEICDTCSASATLFCEGKLVAELPDMFRDLSKRHEIGCHSFAHEWLGIRPPPRWIPHRGELHIVPASAKADLLARAVQSIQAVVGKKPVSFKAPFNSVDHPSTLSLLERVGFWCDSSLPCFDQSFRYLFRPTPTRHASASDMWRKGDLRLVEVPFMIRPQPLFLHPFDSREEVVDTVSRGMKLALSGVEVQCRIDSLIGRDYTVLLVTSHPWEFSEIRPAGGQGAANAHRLARYLEGLSARYDVEFLTVSEFVSKWEKEYCPSHSHKGNPPIESRVC